MNLSKGSYFGGRTPEDGRIAVSVGIGSGIGAIFSAPLGGAVLAAEIMANDAQHEAVLGEQLDPGNVAAIGDLGEFERIGAADGAAEHGFHSRSPQGSGARVR